MANPRRHFLINSMFVSAGLLLPAIKLRATVDESLLSEIRAHKKGVAIWWTGHNGWLIKSDNTLIGTDLALETKSRISSSPITSSDLASELDVSFVTHEHSDHFERETSRALVEKGKCIFVLPESCLEAAHSEVNIPEDRIRVAIPRTSFDIGSVHVDPVRAFHGNSNYAVYYKANLDDCGYVITIGGKRFFQPGDSVLSEDQLFLKDIDVLFFSPTEHNTFIDNSVMLINTLDPKFILPQHRNTFKVTPQTRFWANAYPDEVKMRLSKSLQQRYHVLEMGKKMDIL
jgi:L-ascorbate metabolism protein UlaG (beta-lactamase superfamily)